MNPRFTLRRLEQSSKWLQKLIQNGKFHQLSFKKRQQLVSRIERLKLSLSKFGQFQQVRKVVAGSAVVLSMAFANTATAQNFTTLQTNPFGLTNDYLITFPAAADLDNDGDIDFIIGEADPTGNNLRYFQNTGNASVPAFTQITNSPVANISSSYFAIPSLVDIDNDGDYDLFVTEYYGAINFYENIGTPTNPAFSTPQSAFGLNTAALNASFVDIDFADMDNDGDFDAIVGSYGGAVNYYQNIGTATNAAFTNPVLNPFGMASISSYYAFPALTDIDGDGDLDLFLGTYYGDMEYYENTGTATQAVFGTSVQNPFGIAFNTTGNYLAAPVFVDIDNDGDKDLFSGSYNPGAILYQENLQISVPNNPPTSANGSLTMNQDETTGFDASLFPFSDVDTLQNLTKIKIINLPANGTFNIFGFPVGPNQEITVGDLVGLVYAPTAGQYGTNFDSFSFQVSDGIDYSATAYQFTINVNALPSTIQTTVETYENTDYVFNVADFTFNDPDGGTFQEIQIVTLPNKGQVKLNGTAVTAGDMIATTDFANLVFSPVANENGFPYTNFQFAVGDGTGFSSAATLIINVNFPINTTTITGFNAITLAPNPVSEMANLRIETEVKKSATLSVQNIAGQVVLNQNIELNGDFNAAINVSDWTKGVYIVRLQTIDGEVWTEKLIVQ